MTFQERRIKRRLLRELVDENVDLLAGRTSPRPRGRGRLGRAVRHALTIALPTALVATTLVISGAVQPGSGGSTPEGGREEIRDGVREPAPTAASGAEGVSREASSPGPATPPGESAVNDPRRTRGSARGVQWMREPASPAAATPLPGRILPEPIDASVFPLAVRRIVLDPGHGGENLGTKTPAGLEEKFLTLDISRRVEEALLERGFEVILTRRADESITLQERAAMANRQRADIFVSVHVNWLEGSRQSGIETYYLGPTDDPFLTKLAARENRQSGHSMAELREILDGIYAGVRHDKSHDLAEAIHRSLVRSLGRVNTGLRDRGVKTAPFLVLVDTQMPAVLAEVAALSSEAEAEMLEKPLYREYIADSLAAGIVSYAESFGGSGEVPGASERATATPGDGSRSTGTTAEPVTAATPGAR